MIKSHLSSRDMLGLLEQEHSAILKKVDEFYFALNSLGYEGKTSYDKNLKKINGILSFFKKALLPHIKLDEEIVFPFMTMHVPKLDPILCFFKGEHKELKTCFDDFDFLLRKLKEVKTDARRQVIMANLRDKGIYIVCLLRNHIQAENENIYKSINQQLKRGERAELINQYEYLEGL